MSEKSRQDEAERVRQGAEQVPEVEGHIIRQDPERLAFGTEGAAEAERRSTQIRPEDEPDPADGRAAK